MLFFSLLFALAAGSCLVFGYSRSRRAARLASIPTVALAELASHADRSQVVAVRGRAASDQPVSAPYVERPAVWTAVRREYVASRIGASLRDNDGGPDRQREQRSILEHTVSHRLFRLEADNRSVIVDPKNATVRTFHRHAQRDRAPLLLSGTLFWGNECWIETDVSWIEPGDEMWAIGEPRHSDGEIVLARGKHNLELSPDAPTSLAAGAQRYARVSFVLSGIFAALALILAFLQFV
jgi:hypothetical protein